MYLKPDISNVMFELIKKMPHERLKKIFTKRQMAYTQTEKKKSTPLDNKVYRELVNFNKTKDIFSRIERIDDLTDIIFHVYRKNGEASIHDIEQKFSDTLHRKIEVLEDFGILFRRDDLVILPLEYFFILTDEYVNKRYHADYDTLMKGLFMYSSDEIRILLSYINNTYNESFNTTLSKVYCATMLYVFIIKNRHKLYHNLTKQQKEILRYVLDNNNDIKASKLVQKYPLNDRKVSMWSYSSPSSRDIVDRYNYAEKYKEKKDIKKLFLTGFLVPIGDIYHSLNRVAIPKELYDITAKEYIEELDQKKKQIESAMYSSEKLIPVSCNIIENIRKYMIAIISTDAKVNKNARLSKKSHKIILELTDINEEEQELLFLICSTNKWVRTKKSTGLNCDIAFITGEGFRLFNTYDDAYTIEILEKCRTIVAHRKCHLRYRDNSNEELMSRYDPTAIILSNLNRKPDAWVNTGMFSSYLGQDINFKTIKNLWSDYYYDYYEEVDGASEKKLEDEVKSILNDIYLNLHRIGLLEISESKNGIIENIRLSKFGKILFNNVNSKKNESTKQEDTQVIIQPNNEILVSLDTDLKMISEISHFAYPQKIDKYCIYQISKESVLKSVSCGYDNEKILAFLEKHTVKPLPTTITSIVHSSSSKYGEIEIMDCAGCLVFKDSMLAHEILSNKSMMRLLKIPAAAEDCKNVILIRDKPGVDAIYRLLQKKGYGVKKSKNVT